MAKHPHHRQSPRKRLMWLLLLRASALSEQRCIPVPRAAPCRWGHLVSCPCSDGGLACSWAGLGRRCLGLQEEIRQLGPDFTSPASTCLGAATKPCPLARRGPWGARPSCGCCLPLHRGDAAAAGAAQHSLLPSLEASTTLAGIFMSINPSVSSTSRLLP